MSILIAPSILTADFLNLEHEVLSVSNADLLHVDIMDHHYVPNLTIGEPVIKLLAQKSPLPLDLHLMIDDPDRWAIDYAKMGGKIESITFHMNSRDPARLSGMIRALGIKSCLAIKPNEVVDDALDLLEEFDMILVMTVEPGFGSQKFLDSMLAKVKAIRRRSDINIQVDGGIGDETIKLAAAAGANVFVAGSNIFSSINRPKQILKLKHSAMDAYMKDLIEERGEDTVIQEAVVIPEGIEPEIIMPGSFDDQ